MSNGLVVMVKLVYKRMNNFDGKKLLMILPLKEKSVIVNLPHFCFVFISYEMVNIWHEHFDTNHSLGHIKLKTLEIMWNYTLGFVDNFYYIINQKMAYSIPL